MAQAIRIIGWAGLAACLAIGCYSSSPSESSHLAAAGDGAGQRSITLYVPEMSEKLELL